MITTRAVRHNLERNPLKEDPRFGVMWFSDFRGKKIKCESLQRTRDGRMSEGTDDDECQVMEKAHLAFGQVT